MSEPVKVTVYDPRTGETETADLPANDYILLLGERMELSGMQMYGNGTRVLTIKPTRTE